jgi:hypothetical protein
MVSGGRHPLSATHCPASARTQAARASEKAREGESERTERQQVTSLCRVRNLLDRHLAEVRSRHLENAPLGEVRDTSLVGDCLFLGLYRRAVPRALWCSYGVCYCL